MKLEGLSQVLKMYTVTGDQTLQTIRQNLLHHQKQNTKTLKVTTKGIPVGTLIRQIRHSCLDGIKDLYIFRPHIFAVLLTCTLCACSKKWTTTLHLLQAILHFGPEVGSSTRTPLSHSTHCPMPKELSECWQEGWVHSLHPIPEKSKKGQSATVCVATSHIYGENSHVFIQLWPKSACIQTLASKSPDVM